MKFIVCYNIKIFDKFCFLATRYNNLQLIELISCVSCAQLASGLGIRMVYI